MSTQLQLIVESSTPKVLRSRDREGKSVCLAYKTDLVLKVFFIGRRGDTHDEGTPTPVKKRRTRADD